MDTVGILVAAAAGLVAGFWTPSIAEGIGAARYGPGTDGHDPEDLALAPLRTPSAPALRIWCALVGAIVLASLASTYPSGEVVVVLGGTAIVLGVACVIDLQYLRLPDPLTFGTAVAAFAALALVSVHLDAESSIRGAATGAVSFSGFLFVVAEVFRAVRGRAGMGLGDVKLAIPLGATAGWIGYDVVTGVLGSLQYVVWAVLLGNVLGLVGGLALTRFRPQQSFPFGPFLVAGWLGVLLLAP